MKKIVLNPVSYRFNYQICLWNPNFQSCLVSTFVILKFDMTAFLYILSRPRERGPKMFPICVTSLMHFTLSVPSSQIWGKYVMIFTKIGSYLASFARVDPIVEAGSFVTTNAAQDLIVSIKFWKIKILFSFKLSILLALKLQSQFNFSLKLVYLCPYLYLHLKYRNSYTTLLFRITISLFLPRSEKGVEIRSTVWRGT